MFFGYFDVENIFIDNGEKSRGDLTNISSTTEPLAKTSRPVDNFRHALRTKGTNEDSVFVLNPFAGVESKGGQDSAKGGESDDLTFDDQIYRKYASHACCCLLFVQLVLFVFCSPVVSCCFLTRCLLLLRC